MTKPETPIAATQPEVRPVGTWVVAGFLLVVTLVMWSVVAIIFHARS